MAKSKRNAIPIILSSISIVVGFIALALSAPRPEIACLIEVDYIGIIVAILALITTLLIGMQLYHAFNLKEDAKKVEEALDVIENYSKKVSSLEEKIHELGLRITENPEWLYVITDTKDHILFGIKHDGSIEWGMGIPTPIRKEFEKFDVRIKDIENLS